MLKIAITGGIGSGKTCVTDYLATKGYRIIDADVMAHEMTAPGGKAIPDIIKYFGEEYLNPDGSMNRAKMKALVINDAEAMAKLEECTTKVIIRDVAKLIADAEDAGEKAVFIAAPLLFEKGDRSEYDQVWTVVSDRAARIGRVINRDGVDEDTVDAIMKRQLSDEEKIAQSDVVIYNNGGLNELYETVDQTILENLK